ncbi:unnamed protein product [Closterium sp. NIES-54]
MRKLLLGMRLPNHQWPEAMDHAIMLHNLLSSSSLPNNASPHLLWTGKLGNTKMLRVFGCMILLAMNRKKLRQIDVANAFLYASVDAEIFVELPHGSNASPNQVCRLEKSLYGIKQAPRLWQQHLHARLIRIGFLQLPHDQGMYRLTKGTDYILLIVYVDDLLYIGSTDAITTWFEGELQRDLTLTVATTVTQLGLLGPRVWPLGSGGGGTSGGRSRPQHGGPGGGRGQQQQRRSETQTPQQLREWLVQRGAGEGSETCAYVIRTGARAGRTCGRFHTERGCFARLDDARRAEFGDEVERPRWAQLLHSGVAIFDLDFDVIISAMYALSFSAYYRCVPPDPGIAAAALGASASGTPLGTAPAAALHTFRLDSGASRCFFRDSTTLTPLLAPVPVRLGDPSGSPVVARSSTVLPCPVMSASGQVAASSLCRLLSHQTLLWHHRLGHPSLPRLRGMNSRFVASGLPSSLPPLSPCLPCVEGRQGAAPHSSSFPSMTAPLQTLHMDVWGPARVSGQDRERYFLLVVDDYTRYTTVFPLRSKDEVSAVLIPWICTVRLQLRERFGQDLFVLRLHSDRGGEFSSDLLHYICRGEGITQSFMLPDSPQQNGIAERRIGLVMEVARTSMIHAAAPHFLWPFEVRYAAHQLNLWPRVSLPETSPTLRWMGKGLTTSGVSQVDPLRCTAPVQVAVVSGAAPGAAYGGAASGGAEPGGAGSEGAGSGGAAPEGVKPGGAESEGAEPGGAESEGAKSGGAEPRGAASSGAPGAGKPGDTGAGGAAVTTGAGDPTEPGAAHAGGAELVLEALCGRVHTSFPCFSSSSRSSFASSSCPRPNAMALRPSSVPLRVHQPAPPESSLPEVPDPESDRARAASPTVACLLATAVTDPSFESAAASALVAEQLDFAAACRLNYASALVAESVPASPPSVGGECALGTYVVEDRQEDFECLAAALPRFASLLLAPEGDPDAPDTPTPRSYAKAITGTYVNEVPPPGANIVDGMWIFMVKRPPGSPPAFKARYFARGFSQRQRVDYFQTFSPTPKMTTLRVLLHLAAQRDYELHSLDFSTAFLLGSLHEEIWLRRPPGFTGTFPAGTQGSLRRPVYGLRQAPREWHNTLRTTLAALGFVSSTADPSLFLRTDTSLPTFYVLLYVENLVFAMADIEALTLVKTELQKRHTCTDLGELCSYLGLQITRDRARRTIRLTQSHMVYQVLQCFSFQYSSPQLTPLSTSHSLSAPPSDESVEPSGP